MKASPRAFAALLATCLGLLTLTTFAAPAQAAAPASSADIQLSEVESNGGTPGEWIEPHNTSGQQEDLTGWWLSDDGGKDGTHHFVIPDGTLIDPDGYLAFDVEGDSKAPAHFGLGGADAARLFHGTDALVDMVSWTAHAGGTYDRCAIDDSGHTGWVDVATSTEGAANACPDVAIARPPSRAR